MSHGWHAILVATTVYQCDTEIRAYLQTLAAARDGTSRRPEGLHSCLVAGNLSGSSAEEKGGRDGLSHVAGLGDPVGPL